VSLRQKYEAGIKMLHEFVARITDREEKRKGEIKEI
jgi:hypothetical protein